MGVTSGCGSDVGPADLETPDPSRVLVYFPIGEGGLVRGRAFAGFFSSNDAVPFAVVRSHPTSLREVVFEVDANGGFDFSLFASGREVLEIAGTTDRTASVVGPSVFVEVPPVPVPAAVFRCCRNAGAAQGACVTRNEYAARIDPITGDLAGCPAGDPRPVNQCETDRDCIVLSRRHYEIDAERVRLGAPGTDGNVTVVGEAGAVLPNGLVLVENRRLQGVGRDEPSLRRTVIANEDGSFVTRPFPAKGDDEIVLEVVDLNDFRSPTLSLFVDDAPLESAHLVEVWPLSDLSTQLGGFVGLRFWLTGRDGRGVCPDAPELDPAFCLSGGLDFEHVTITGAFVDRVGQTVQLCRALTGDDPVPTEPPCGGPGVQRLVAPTLPRGLEGNVRAEGENVVIIVDLSDGSASVPARQTYFEGLAELAGRLRPRDRVAISVRDRIYTGLMEREAAVAELLALGGQATSGTHRPFLAVDRAALEVSNDPARGARSSRILLTGITAASALPSDAEFDAVVERVQAGDFAGDQGFPVDIVGIDLVNAPPGAGLEAERRARMRRLLDSLAAFSGPVGAPGRNFGTVDNTLELRLRLRDVAGQVVGGFNLLYELVQREDGLEIDNTVGKLGELTIEAEVEVPTGRANLRYQGPLEFKKLITP